MVTKAATSTLGGSRDRGATGSRGSADPPLFRVRGPHAAFDHQFLSTIPTSTHSFRYPPWHLGVVVHLLVRFSCAIHSISKLCVKKQDTALYYAVLNAGLCKSQQTFP